MRSQNRLAIAFTLVLLVCGLAGTAVAQDMETAEGISLTGQLSENPDGYFVLIDAESGEELGLRGSEEELAEHVGLTVTVSGNWAKDDSGNTYFAVTAVEPAEE